MLERGPRFSSVSAVQEEPATLDPQYEGGVFVNPVLECATKLESNKRGDVRMNDLKS